MSADIAILPAYEYRHLLSIAIKEQELRKDIFRRMIDPHEGEHDG